MSIMGEINTGFTIFACVLDAVCLGAVFYIDRRYKKRFDRWENTLNKIRLDLNKLTAEGKKEKS